MRNILFFLFVSITSASTAGETAMVGDFYLRSTVVEALEGGPVIIKITLVYQGKQDIEVHQSSIERPFFHIEAGIPGEWKQKLGPLFGSMFGSPDGHRTIKPGEEWSETILLHQLYDNITPGSARLKFGWAIRSPQVNHAILAYPKLAIDLEIKPASSKHLAALRNRLERTLERGDIKSEELREVANTILDTSHVALVPVAWRLIESSISSHDDRLPKWKLFSFIDAGSKNKADVHARLVKLACNPSWPAKTELFEHWRACQPELTQEHLQQLATGGSVWTKILTYTTFPKRHDAASAKKLFATLSDLNQPLPAAEFTQLLSLLDDDSFEVREKASADLEAAGERVVGKLRRYLTQPLSPEAKRRVRVALESIENVKPPPDGVNTLGYLRNLDTREARQVIEVLAESTADTWLRKEAAKILAEKKKRAGK